MILALDMSIRPLGDWTFKCPMDIQICPFVHWTNGHSKCPLDISVCLMDGLHHILDIPVRRI